MRIYSSKPVGYIKPLLYELCSPGFFPSMFAPPMLRPSKSRRRRVRVKSIGVELERIGKFHRLTSAGGKQQFRRVGKWPWDEYLMNNGFDHKPVHIKTHFCLFYFYRICVNLRIRRITRLLLRGKRNWVAKRAINAGDADSWSRTSLAARA